MGPDSPVNGAREINSNVKVKQLLALIEEKEINTQEAILEN